MLNLEDILNNSKTLSDISNYIFGSKNYWCREKCKKILNEHNIDWQEWLNTKKPPKKYCLFCGKELTGKYKNRKKFCNSSCSASFNNKVSKTKQKRKCLFCGKEIKSYKFCSSECHRLYNYNKFITKWKNNEIKNGIIKDYIRQYIFNKYNNSCQICGFNTLNPFTNRSILQIHHIDGDCQNNKENNLQLLCPNCHALTENYGSRNKNSTRIDKRLKKYQQ